MNPTTRQIENLRRSLGWRKQPGRGSGGGTCSCGQCVRERRFLKRSIARATRRLGRALALATED